jgi:DNA-binding FadR family transcriptional regulator
MVGPIGSPENRVIHEVAKTLSYILGEIRSEALQGEERRRASVRTHILIIDALERGDGEGAREAMGRHLAEIERTVFGCEAAKEGRTAPRA